MNLFPGILFVLLPVAFVLWNGGVHKINEGHVGVYYRGGAILNELTHPGFHFALPVVTQVYQVQTSVQTDQVTNIPWGTSGGVVIIFEKIEVVNRLKLEYVYETVKNYTVDYDKTWIFDKIHHEINQFCSKNTLQDVYIDKFDTLDESLTETLSSSLKIWAPGIEIISIRVTKPKVPESLRLSYEKRESEMLAQKLKLQTEKALMEIIQQQAETKKKEAVILAQMDSDVSKIKMEKIIQEKEAQKRIALIQNEIELAQKKAETDAKYYKEVKEIEANEKKLTPQYLKYSLIQGLTNNVKLYFGESIPKYIGESMKLLDFDKTE